MSGDRRLIVNADDLGRSPGINRGIVECHLNGIVTSATLMVNLPSTADALQRLGDCPNLGVGLHLNYCYGEPVAPAAQLGSLTRGADSFVTDTGWLCRNADPQEIEAETRAQLERFVELVGRMPTHLDSHKYLHTCERFREPVIIVAGEAGVPIRAVTDADRQAARSSGVRAPDAFEGRFHGLDGIGVSAEILLAAIEDIGPGVTELMCHPGYVDEWIRDSSYAADREREIAALCDSRVLDAIERRDIKLATFRGV